MSPLQSWLSFLEFRLALIGRLCGGRACLGVEFKIGFGNDLVYFDQSKCIYYSPLLCIFTFQIPLL